ncbi:hypothetical protein CPEBRM1_ABPJDJAI_01514 [Companilactobacillus paralimentarius]|uniref:hypothetical protein n=1 Tax=Companilactobacillus paralimentarius TaxID=83526 RepID=UPI00384C0128
MQAEIENNSLNKLKAEFVEAIIFKIQKTLQDLDGKYPNLGGHTFYIKRVLKEIVKN